MTLFVWLVSSVMALVLGTFWGVLRSYHMRIRYVSCFLDLASFILRGIPYYVQLLIAYFVIPHIVGINVSALTAAIISLGLCSSAYISQVVYGTMNALPSGLWEACFVLGYSSYQALIRVILPLTVRNALPVFINELDQLLKTTAILSTIGILELTRAGMNIIAREMNPIPVYLTLALIYLAASTVLTLVSRVVEKRMSYVVR